MKEIEILVKVNEDIDKVNEVLSSFKYVGTKSFFDEYYYDPNNDELKPDSNNRLTRCLRLRTVEDTYTITYKKDVFDDDKWLYSDEYETKVDSIINMRLILDNLRFKKLLEIKSTKTIYQADKYEITIEEVDNLGLFMEVEYCTNEAVDIKKVKKEIQNFLDNLGLNVSKELNMGKPEMMIRENNTIY